MLFFFFFLHEKYEKFPKKFLRRQLNYENNCSSDDLSNFKEYIFFNEVLRNNERKKNVSVNLLLFIYYKNSAAAEKWFEIILRDIGIISVMN